MSPRVVSRGPPQRSLLSLHGRKRGRPFKIRNPSALQLAALVTGIFAFFHISRHNS